jgi:DNA polymerase
MTPLVKCNTGGKSLSRESIEACRTHLDAQLDLIRPKVILALGDIVFSSLCRKFMDMETNHGKIFYYNKIPFFPIYHPRTVRIREELKRSVWNDLKNFSSWYREH